MSSGCPTQLSLWQFPPLLLACLSELHRMGLPRLRLREAFQSAFVPVDSLATGTTRAFASESRKRSTWSPVAQTSTGSGQSTAVFSRFTAAPRYTGAESCWSQVVPFLRRRTWKQAKLLYFLSPNPDGGTGTTPLDG